MELYRDAEFGSCLVTARAAAIPARWRAERRNPRRSAQRQLPSTMKAA
jgi:hypothetical protein